MRKLMLTLTAACCLPLSTTFAYDEERAKQNFSTELVICAAYLSIGAEGARRTGNENASQTLEAASKALLENARKHNKDETVLARFQLAMEEQINLMHKDYANLSILTVKYKDLCRQVLENPQARLDYWRQKK